MVEEGENQVLKRIGFEEEADEDGISKLPDCLLVEILSRLPSTEDTIRTGALSKRWKHLWTCVTNLIFLHPNEFYANPNFYFYVDKTLTQCRQSKLNKFKLHSCYNPRFESHVNNWIRYAVHCNVQHLHLSLLCPNRIDEFPLDEFFFISSCFTHLTFSGCAFNPTESIRWENLRSLSIGFAKLEEDVIENVLSGSPVLETLVVNHCYGYRRLNITSKSVNNLVVVGYMYPSLHCIIEINAPNILSLKIQGGLWLREILLLNVSSLVEAHLDYRMACGHYKYETTLQEEMLKELILNLLHVKDLKIGSSCVMVLDRLKAKGFGFPSNLKVLDATSSPL